jgi:hypothetical protein
VKADVQMIVKIILQINVLGLPLIIMALMKVVVSLKLVKA